MDENQRVGRLLGRLMIAAGVLACLGTLLGYAGNWWWAFDLFSTFRVHYLAMLLTLLAAALLGRRMGWAILAIGWAQSAGSEPVGE